MWRIRTSAKVQLLVFFFCLLECGKAHDDTTTARRSASASPSLRAGCDCASLLAEAAPARALASECGGVVLPAWIVISSAGLTSSCCLGGVLVWIWWTVCRQRRPQEVAPAPAKAVAECEAQTLPQVMAELGVGHQLPVDLVCCLDSSASVGKGDFFLSVGFVRDIVEKLDMPNSSVGVLAFHHEIIQSQTLPLTDDKDKLMQHLENLSFEAGETRLAKPLRLAAGMLTSHERPKNRRKIILVVTDGDPNDPGEASKAAADLKGLDVELFVVQAGEADNPAATCALATTSKGSELLVELKGYDLLKDSSSEVLQKLLHVSLYVRRAKCALNLKCYQEVSNIQTVQGIDMMVAGWETEGEDSWNWKYHSEKMLLHPQTRPWDPSFSQPVLPTPPPTKTEPPSPDRMLEVVLKEMQEMQETHSAELLFWQHGCSEGNEERRQLRESLEDESRRRQKNDEAHASELRKMTELKTQAESQIDKLQKALDAMATQAAAHQHELDALRAASLEESKKVHEEAIEKLKSHHDAQLKQESEQHGKTVEGMRKHHEAELSKLSLEAEVTHLKSMIAEGDKHAKGFQAEITKLENTVTEKERTIETLTKELAESKEHNAAPADVGTNTECVVATQASAVFGPSTEVIATQTSGVPADVGTNTECVVATQTSAVFGPSTEVIATQTSGVPADVGTNTECVVATQTSDVFEPSAKSVGATQTPPHVLAELAVGGQLPVDIVCCLDSSASVGCDGFEKSVSFFRHILGQLEMPKSEAGLLTFNHDYTLVSKLMGDKDHLLECLKNIHFEPGETNLAVPLKRAAEMLTHSDRSKDRRKIILVVTDGNPNDLEEVTKTAADLKYVSGLQLCFVLVGKAMNFKTFSSLASTSANGGVLLHKLRSYDELPLSSSAVLEKVLEVYLYVRRAKYVIDLNSYENVDDVSDSHSSNQKGIKIPGWQAPGWQAVYDVSAHTGYDLMIPGWQASDDDSWIWKPCPRQVLPDAKVWPWQQHTEHALPRLLSADLAGISAMDGSGGQQHNTHPLSALSALFSGDLAGISIMQGSTGFPVGKDRSHLLSALPEIMHAHLAGINVMEDSRYGVEQACSTGSTDDFAARQAAMDEFDKRLQLLRQRR